MQSRTPFFLLRARDIVIFLLFIIGLGLLLIYGAKAIAEASDIKYVNGWENRPFKTVPVINEIRAAPYLSASFGIYSQPILQSYESEYQSTSTGPDQNGGGLSGLPAGKETYISNRSNSIRQNSKPELNFSFRKFLRQQNL